jgi:hypothetical protein
VTVEIRLADEVSWRDRPAAWNAERVMNLEEQEWVHPWRRTLVSGERRGPGPRDAV